MMWTTTGADEIPENADAGYVNTKITTGGLTAGFQVLDYVTTPGSPVSTKASFQIKDQVLGLQACGFRCVWP